MSFKKLNSTPPEGVKKPASVMTMEVTVDNKPQELKKVRDFAVMVKNVPTTLTPEAQIVLQALFDCFSRSNRVEEGLVGDLGWGFAQCGIPPHCTAVGLKDLEKNAYIKFQAPDNTFIEATSDHIDKSWVRYQTKLLDMVYEPKETIVAREGV